MKMHEMDLSDVIYKCENCEYKTELEDSLKTHKKTCSTRVKTYQHRCKTCDYRSNVKSNLKRHEMTHLNVFLYKCHECDYKTKRKFSLRNHQTRMHSKKQTKHFVDTINKALNFADTSALNSKKDIISNELVLLDNFMQLDFQANSNPENKLLQGELSNCTNDHLNLKEKPTDMLLEKIVEKETNSTITKFCTNSDEHQVNKDIMHDMSSELLSSDILTQLDSQANNQSEIELLPHEFNNCTTLHLNLNEKDSDIHLENLIEHEKDAKIWKFCTKSDEHQVNNGKIQNMSGELVSLVNLTQLDSQANIHSKIECLHCEFNNCTTLYLNLKERDTNISLEKLIENEIPAQIMKFCTNSDEHQVNKDEPKNSTCDEVFQQFTEAVFVEMQNEKWKCTDCKFSTNDRQEFGNHPCAPFRMIDEYQCGKCSYRTDNEFLFLNHMNIHYRKRPYKCGFANTL